MATDYTLDSRCKLAYLFKEGSGTSVADATGNGNTGTFNSSGHPAWDTAKPTFGSSGAGFGSAKYATTGALEIITDGTSNSFLPNHNAAWTFSCWFNCSTDTIGGGDPRFFVRGSVYVAFSQTQKVYVNIDGGTGLTRFTVASAWALNTWTHLTVTSDGSTTATNYKIYINGVEASYGAATNGVTPTSNSGATLYLGNTSTGSRAMPGYLTEVGFFNAALSSSEVLEIYNTGLKPPVVTITPSALTLTSLAQPSNRAKLNISASVQTPTIVIGGANVTISAGLLNIASAILAPTINLGTSVDIGFGLGVLALPQTSFTAITNTTIQPNALNITVSTKASSMSGSSVHPVSALSITSSAKTATVTSRIDTSISTVALTISSSTRGPLVNGAVGRRRNQLIFIG